jgi:hypothetical protein
MPAFWRRSVALQLGVVMRDKALIRDELEMKVTGILSV